MPIETMILLLFPALMIFAGVMDIFTMTIPNRVPLAMVAGFACLAPFTGLGLEAVAIHIAVSLAMLVVGIGIFAGGWMGGGDAKLFAAIAMWMGAEHIYEYALISALFGGVITLLVLFVRTVPLPEKIVGQEWVNRLYDASRGVPYGVALAAGGLFVYPNIGWIQQLH